MRIVKKQNSGAFVISKRLTIYPSHVRNPLLADVEHNIGVAQTWVAVDTRTRQIVATDIVLHLLLDNDKLNGYEVGIDPSCEPLINYVDRKEYGYP